MAIVLTAQEARQLNLNCTRDKSVKGTDKNATGQDNAAKKSKYKNRRIRIDGILFDSILEGDYYCYLKLMAKVREIIAFSIKPRIVLVEGNRKIKPITYIPDFCVTDKTGHNFYADTKGARTELYKDKIKMLYLKYPRIDFREIKAGDF